MALQQKRFRLFVDAKEAYEAFQAKHLEKGRPIADILPEEQEQASRDPQLREAERKFREARRLSEEADALNDVGTATIQLGYLHFVFGEMAQAEKEFQSALELFSNMPFTAGQKGSRSAGHYFIGAILARRGEREAAIREFSRSHLIDSQLADVGGQLETERKVQDLGAEIEEQGLSLLERASSWKLVDEPPAPREIPPKPSKFLAEGRFPDRREVIRLLSCREEAGDAVHACLLSLGDTVGRSLSVHRSAAESPDQQRRDFPPLEQGQHLCVLIAVMDRAGLETPSYVARLGSYVQQVRDDQHFRFIVYLSDLTLQDLREKALDNHLIEELLQFVQIEEKTAIDDLRDRLVTFVKNVDLQQARVQFEDANRAMVTLFGGLWIPVTLILVVAVAIAGYGQWRGHPVGWSAAAADVLLGFGAVVLQAPIAFYVFRGLLATYLTYRNEDFMRTFQRGFVTIFVLNWLAHWLGSHQVSSWLCFGTILGIELDCARRAAVSARREGLDLVVNEKAARVSWGSPDEGVRPAQVSWCCPYMPRGTKPTRVFISYSRGSENASRFATALCSALWDADTRPFLDRHSIPLGSNWRAELNRNIGQCDVFVCVLDEQAVTRSWVAAELMTAVDASLISGGPEILILLDPSVDLSADGVLPPIRTIVEIYQWNQWDGQPKVIPLHAQSSHAIAWSLSRSKYKPESVIRGPAVYPFGIFMAIVGSFSLLGVIAGVVCLILGFMQIQTKYPFTDWVLAHGAGSALFLCTAFWLGASTRMSTELMAFGRGVLTLQSITAAGQILTLSLLWSLVPDSLHWWAPLLVVAAHMIQTSFQNGSESDGLWVR